MTTAMALLTCSFFYHEVPRFYEGAVFLFKDDEFNVGRCFFDFALYSLLAKYRIILQMMIFQVEIEVRKDRFSPKMNCYIGILLLNYHTDSIPPKI